MHALAVLQRLTVLPIVGLLGLPMTTFGQASTRGADAFQSGRFQWQVSPPLLAVDDQRLPVSPEHAWVAVKDPSIVWHEGRWHLFCTLRKLKSGDGRIRIGYLSFEEWSQAQQSTWSLLTLTDGYHGAPQVFFFEVQKLWYLIYQAADEDRGLKYGPCYSTNKNIDDPSAWTLPRPLYVVEPGTKAGLDYWVICDADQAHLFFTSLDGRMWRAATSLKNFPDRGWTKPKVALQADIFEASHTYALRGHGQFLTIVEAQAGRRRYFKAFLAGTLEGPWSPLAASPSKPFVAPSNVTNQTDAWASSYSHGELIRAGVNQRLEIDPQRIQMLFQGASDDEYQSGNYGEIPWRLGLLKQVD